MCLKVRNVLQTPCGVMSGMGRNHMGLNCIELKVWKSAMEHGGFVISCVCSGGRGVQNGLCSAGSDAFSATDGLGSLGQGLCSFGRMGSTHIYSDQGDDS